MSVIQEPSGSNREGRDSVIAAQSGPMSGPRVKTRLVRHTFPGQFDSDPVESTEAPDQTQPIGFVTAIGGPGRGTSFDLTAEFMRVGRDLSQEIHLPQDDAISRDCHAIVGFNPDLGRFMIFDGGKANPVWVNSKQIGDAVVLENEDIIRIGQTTLCLTYY